MKYLDNNKIEEIRQITDNKNDRVIENIENGQIKNSSKVKSTLTKSKIIKRVKELENQLEFSGFEFNFDGGIKGCEEGFDCVINRRIMKVQEELEDFYEKTNGFDGMDSFRELYEELESKTECFLEDVYELKNRSNLDSREEIMNKCVLDLFKLRVSTNLFTKKEIKGDSNLSSILSIIVNFENILGEVFLIEEFNEVEEQDDLSNEVKQFIDESSLELYKLHRQIHNLSEEVYELISEYKDESTIRHENEKLVDFFSILQGLIDNIEILLKTEGTRCEEIEYEWEQLYLKYSDSLVDEYEG